MYLTFLSRHLHALLCEGNGMIFSGSPAGCRMASAHSRQKVKTMGNIKFLHHIWVKGELGWWGSQGSNFLVWLEKHLICLYFVTVVSCLFCYSVQWFSPGMWHDLLTSQFSNPCSISHLKLLILSAFSMLFCPIPNFISYWYSSCYLPFLILWKKNSLWRLLDVKSKVYLPQVARGLTWPQRCWGIIYPLP